MTDNKARIEQLRLLAERIVQNKDAGEKNGSIAEIQEVIHELAVYQIELEMQNDELRHVQSELEQSEDKYAKLFKYAPVSYLIIDNDSSIVQANKTCMDKFGIEQKTLQDMPITYLVASHDRDSYYLHHRQLIQSREPQISELWFLKQSGEPFFAQVESALLNPKHGQDNTTLITLTDISKRFELEERRSSLQKLEQTILSSKSIEDIVKVVLAYIQNIARSYHTSVILFDPLMQKATIYTLNTQENELSQIVGSLHQFKDFQSIKAGDYYVINKTRVLDQFHEEKQTAHLVVPIYQENLCVGIIDIASQSVHDLSQNIIQLVQEMVIELSVAIKQAWVYENIYRNNKELEDRVQARTHQLQESERSEHQHRLFAEALLEITKQLNVSMDLEHILEHILINLERIITYDGANIVLLENDKARLAQFRGNYPEHFENFFAEDLLEHQFFAFEYMLNTGQPILISDVSTDESWVDSPLLSKIQCYMGVPIYIQNETLGFINIDKFEKNYFQEQHLKRLQAFAGHVAIAIKNAISYQQSQEMAILQERQRLAHELHDAVSQVLFSLNITAETLDKKAINDLSHIKKYTEMISTLAASAQAEMRLLLLELRPMNMEKVTLQQLLNYLVAGLRGRKEVNVNLVIEDVIPLDAKTKNVLFRITQEILINISKHSQATQVDVNISIDNDNLILNILDNGIGFDIDKLTSDEHGLSTLKVRAMSIGAILELSSSFNQGTQIKVTYPLVNNLN